MKNRFFGNRLALSFILIGTLTLTGCENGNIFGGLYDRGDGGDVKSLNADGASALKEKNYTQALDLYQRALAQEPRNSEALYGAAAAAMGTSGVSLGVLFSNVTDNLATASSIHGLEDMMAASRNHMVVENATDPTSLLYGIAISNLDAIIDNVICWLSLIVGQVADGTIDINNKDHVYVLIDLANLCAIRPVLRFLREGLGDLRNTNGDYEFVIDPTLTAAVCNGTNLVGDFSSAAEQQEFLVGLAQDIVSAYQLYKRVVEVLGLGNDRVVTKLQREVEDAIEQLLFDDPLDGAQQILPQACLNLFSINGITTASFTSDTDVFDNPPSSCPLIP